MKHFNTTFGSVKHIHNFWCQMLNFFKSKLAKNNIFIRSKTIGGNLSNLDPKPFMNLNCSSLSIQNVQNFIKSANYIDAEVLACSYE